MTIYTILDYMIMVGSIALGGLIFGISMYLISKFAKGEYHYED